MPDKQFISVNGGKRTLDIELSDGTRWSIPLLSSLSVREARAFSRKLRASEDDATDVFIDYLDEKCPGLVDVLSLSDLNDIARLWNQAEIERGDNSGE